VATGEEVVLRNLRRICSPGALLEIVIGLDPERDRMELERLGLPALSDAYMDSVLLPRYKEAGFEVLEKGMLSQSEWPRLQSSWARRLQGNVSRSLIYIIARAAEREQSNS
jgi:hypothetical protein